MLDRAAARRDRARVHLRIPHDIEPKPGCILIGAREAHNGRCVGAVETSSTMKWRWRTYTREPGWIEISFATLHRASRAAFDGASGTVRSRHPSEIRGCAASISGATFDHPA